MVVCGTNERLRARQVASPAPREPGASARSASPRDVDVLLECCDVVVSKAGGLTCSEALVKRTPLVVFKPTPGQEVRNAEYLEAAGAAVHADSIEDVERLVHAWLTNSVARERTREVQSKLAHADAALSIARQVLDAATEPVASRA